MSSYLTASTTGQSAPIIHSPDYYLTSAVAPVLSMNSQACTPAVFGNLQGTHPFPFKPDIPIDPALIPLPHELSNNAFKSLQPMVSGSCLPLPAFKVAGSRRKNKGKKRVADDDLSEVRVPKRGRPSGASNFSEADINMLLDAVADECPLGERGWKAVANAYNKYAHNRGRRLRTHKSLENKFKQFVKGGKPTGWGECPPHIERAFMIEDLINERAGTRDVNDSDLDEPMPDAASVGHEAIEISSDDEPEKVVATVKKVDQQAPVIHRKQAISGLGLMKKIADSFDPSSQRRRESDRAEQSLSAIQILTLSQQLRDAQQSNNVLRSEITELYSRLHASEIARERLDLKLELLELSGHKTMKWPARNHKRIRHRHRRHEELLHADGNISVISLTDTDSLSSNDPNKENYCRPRGKPLTRACPMKLEDIPSTMLARNPLQDCPMNISTEFDLSLPSTTLVTPSSDAMNI